MTPKNIKTQAVEKNDYRVYTRKAKDFYDTMLKALELKNWTAADRFYSHAISKLPI